MKKFKNVLLLCCLLFVLTACGTKSITEAQFAEEMQNLGYEITNDEEYSDNYDFITNVVIAYSEDITYQFEFYSFTTNNYAKRFFDINQEIVEENIGIKTHTESHSMNKDTYTSISDTTYTKIIRVKDTCLYIQVDSQYQDKAEEVVDVIGY